MTVIPSCCLCKNSPEGLKLSLENSGYSTGVMTVRAPTHTWILCVPLRSLAVRRRREGNTDTAFYQTEMIKK